MSDNRETYKTPFEERYSSKEMLYIFSDKFKFSTWRRIWSVLAEEEKKLGIKITDAQIKELQSNIDNIDFKYAKKKEKEFRHDVMAHIHTYAKVAPKAAPIIHLGATSAFVGDNTDIIQIKEALKIVRQKLYNVIINLNDEAQLLKDIPTLGFTHYQPAQPTTIGKRFTLWIQDFVDDFYEIDKLITSIRFRGAKGTTGTQASFLELFDGDKNKVFELDENVSRSLGFESKYEVTGQTYSRRLDSLVAKVLSIFAEDSHKFATDLRLLQNRKEIEEPFEKSQVGSSAMAYKRNPMRSERICSLARFIMSISTSLGYTASTQWFERTLDDSANKRISIPQIFLSVDAILEILLNISKGLVVNKKVIEKNLLEEVPFMITENVMMKAVENGGSRQEIHEEIRKLSHKCAYEIKNEGKDNNLLKYMSNSKLIGLDLKDIKQIASTKKLTGLSKEQTLRFNKNVVSKLKKKFSYLLSDDGGNLSV